METFAQNAPNDSEVTPLNHNKGACHEGEDSDQSILKELHYTHSAQLAKNKHFTPAPMDDPLKIHFKMQQDAANAKREKQKIQFKKRMEKLIRKH